MQTNLKSDHIARDSQQSEWCVTATTEKKERKKHSKEEIEWNKRAKSEREGGEKKLNQPGFRSITLRSCKLQPNGWVSVSMGRARAESAVEIKNSRRKSWKNREQADH